MLTITRSFLAAVMSHPTPVCSAFSATVGSTFGAGLEKVSLHPARSLWRLPDSLSANGASRPASQILPWTSPGVWLSSSPRITLSPIRQAIGCLYSKFSNIAPSFCSVVNLVVPASPRICFLVLVTHRFQPAADHTAQTSAFPPRKMAKLAIYPDFTFQILQPER